MAIARDTSTDGGLTNPGTSHTFSHTCTGTNLVLIVSVFSASTDIVTGVTYAGTPMSLVGKCGDGGSPDTNDRWGYQFILVNPATGANNVVVSTSASDAIGAHAVSYTGATQSGQPDASAIAGPPDVSGNLVTTVNSVADNCFAVLTLRTATAGAAAGTGSTQLQGSSGLYTAEFSGSPKTPAGAISMTYTSCAAAAGGSIICTLSPAVGGGGGTTPHFLGILGAGA